MIDKLDIEKLQHLPIEHVAEALGMTVTHHKALCPFHADKHPSLTFHRGRNRYRCFVCDAHGGPIDLVMNLLHKSFLEACQWLGAEEIQGSKFKVQTVAEPVEAPKPFNASKYERFFQRPWLSEEAKHFLFEERRLDARVVRWCRLTSWRDKQGTPWLQTPYYSREGKLIGIQNRNLAYRPHSALDAESPQPRFKFPQGAKCSIYNLPVLNRLQTGDVLYIAEGCSDAWSLLSSGHKSIAIPSATLLSKKDKEQLSIINSQLSIRFAMYPDQDAPGERLFLQLRDILPNLERHQLPSNCKDYSDYYLQSLDPHSALDAESPSSLNSQPSTLLKR